jgi:predicted phosphodiesterase
MEAHLRIIGDVHGQMNQYVQLACKSKYSVQLGDLSFNYAKLAALDPANHRVLGGNHDNYLEENGKFVNQPSHFLGDYGIHHVPKIGNFFFVRGGHSIDKDGRKEGVDWFPQEQISYASGTKAFDLYQQIKPDFVISHECPESVIDMIAGIKTWNGMPIHPSMTSQLLEQMLQFHHPKLWIFGHHHEDFDMNVDGTRFVCLPVLKCFDFEEGDL